MRVSRKWLLWAHTPGYEDGQERAGRLVALAAGPGRGAVEVDDVELVKEVVSVAELYRRPVRGDSLFDMGPWWRYQPAKVVNEGRRCLRGIAAAPAPSPNNKVSR